jgi:hypothetical protein
MLLLRYVSPLALGAMFVLPSPSRDREARGFTYDLVQQAHISNSRRGDRDVVTLRAHVQVDVAGNSRMDIVEAGQSPVWAAGDYAITSRDTLLVVSPDKKQYFVLGPDFGAGEMEEFMHSSGMEMKVKDGGFAFDSLPDGGLIDGRKTRHFRMSHQGFMNMTMPTGETEVAFKSETDYFVTRERAPDATSFFGPSTFGAGPAGMMSPAMADKMRAAIGTMKGFVVRSVTHTNSMMTENTTDRTQTTDAQNLQEADVASISLTPPSGYARVDLSTRMRAMAAR